MTGTQLTLPTFGTLGQGFSALSDPPLNHKWKLPILHKDDEPADTDLIFQTCVGFILTVLAKENVMSEQGLQQMIAGVAFMLKYDLIGYRREVINGQRKLIPDGYWKPTNTPITIPDDWTGKINDICSPENMKTASRIIIAKKAIWWTGNESIYQMMPDVNRALGISYESYRGWDAPIMDIWVSTIKILSLAGIPGLKPYSPIGNPHDSQMQLSSEEKEMFASMPLGTENHAVAFEGAKELIKSDYAKFCPYIESFTSLFTVHQQILDDPALYHKEAAYLTDGTKATNFADSSVKKYSGRIGSYVSHKMKESDLANKPHFYSWNIENYEDYDPEWNAVLEYSRMASSEIRSSDAQVEQMRNLFFPAPNIINEA